LRNRTVFSVVFSQEKSAAERVGMWEFAAGSRLVSLKTRVRRISKRRWELWESGFFDFRNFHGRGISTRFFWVLYVRISFVSRSQLVMVAD